jgi:hypothetical protein
MSTVQVAPAAMVASVPASGTPALQSPGLLQFPAPEKVVCALELKPIVASIIIMYSFFIIFMF